MSTESMQTVAENLASITVAGLVAYALLGAKRIENHCIAEGYYVE